MKRTIRLGTRGSQLALWQARWVKSALESRFLDLLVELIVIKTKGDKILDVPLAQVGGKGLFVKEIEEAIIDKRVDLAVHSMKDMPAELPVGLCISAVPEREIPLDAIVSRNRLCLSDLPPGAVIGTSSLRRSAQLRRRRPDFHIVTLRGNLDTRLKKLESEQLDAIVLAAAGLKRMGLADRITEYLEESVMLPAVGQGALCIESRADDPIIGPFLATLDDPDTRAAVMGERAFLCRLEGGCQVPIAANGKLLEGSGILRLRGLISSVDGSSVVEGTHEGPLRESERIGKELADRLLKNGADAILENLKGQNE